MILTFFTELKYSETKTCITNLYTIYFVQLQKYTVIKKKCTHRYYIFVTLNFSFIETLDKIKIVQKPWCCMPV